MQVHAQQTLHQFTESAHLQQPQQPLPQEQQPISQSSNHTTSPSGSHQKSDKSSQDAQSSISTESDNAVGYVSLKSIKSKEEIELESKENEEILTNLNFNIDDLFRKISSLTDEITTELQPKIIKQRTSPLKVNSLHNIPFANGQPALTEHSSKQQDQKDSSSSNQNQSTKPNHFLFSPSRLFPQLPNPKSSYMPIFFQHHRPQTKQHSIKMKLFQTGKSLGCGKFGEVVQCRNLKTNTLYALKKIFKSVIDEYNMEEQLLTELRILKQIDHPNIVKAYESFTDDFHIFILMEYIHGPLLVKKLKCSQNQCKIIIKQVLQALKYLHENKIAHRDIKPQNIILTADNVVKICDFGWASQDEQEMNILCGTLDYVSPQMAKQSPYTEKSDLWNLGVLAYELIYGYPPFKGSSKSRIFEKVRNLQYTFSDEIEISEQCKDFISGFIKEEHERASIEWGLSHQFLKLNLQKKEEEIVQKNEQSYDSLTLLQEMKQLMQEE